MTLTDVGTRIRFAELTLQDADRIVTLPANRILNHASLRLAPAADRPTRVLFQYELVGKPVRLTACVAHPFRDLRTGDILYLPFPPEVEAAGILGPRLTAFAACLNREIKDTHFFNFAAGIGLQAFYGALRPMPAVRFGVLSGWRRV